MSKINRNYKVIGVKDISNTAIALDAADGANFAEILEENEGLSPEDIQACILFASKSS